MGRHERADWPIGHGAVSILLDLYEVGDDGVRERLLSVADQAWRLHHWDTGDQLPHDDADAPFITVEWLAGRATTIRVFAPVLRIRHLPASRAIPVELVMPQSALRQLNNDDPISDANASHLAELVSQRNVRARVLPDGTASTLAVGSGFTAFALPHPYPPAVYQDGLAGCLYIEGSAAERLVHLFHRLRARALDMATSQELINRAIARRG